MTIQAKLLFNLIGPRTLGRFDARCKRPLSEQEELLQSIVDANAETVFGRCCQFQKIGSFRDFQRQVPLMEYEELEPFVDAARRGEPAQLTRETPAFYAKTSGTTGASKYIPVTKTSRRAKAGLMRVWLSAFFRDHRPALDGKILQVASPEVEDLAPDGTPCGAETGHAYRNMPRVMRGLYPVPYEVCEIPDYEARYYTYLRLALMHSLTAIGTPNPSTILMLFRRLAAQTERLVRDVRDGTLDRELVVLPEIRRQLEEELAPNPERAAFLERAATAGDGHLTAREVWPDLQALACWKGGSVGSYLDQLAPSLPEGLPVRDLGWLSSECRGSVPLSDEGDSGPLSVATNVYEFLPERAEQPRPTDLLTVAQVEVGGRYQVYVTTSGGLYRYAMHDILEVTGFHQNTPCVRFVQKTEGILSFTGEKLTEAQVLGAAEEILAMRGNHRQFIAAVGRPPTRGADPYYLFLVEYDAPPGGGDAVRTARELDGALARRNSEYASKRASGRLGGVVLRVLEPGQFEEFYGRAIQGGAHDGQFKILRLTDDEEFASSFPRVVGDYAAA